MDQMMKNVIILFNRIKTPMAHCLIIFLVMCLFINIYLTFSANTTKFDNPKI